MTATLLRMRRILASAFAFTMLLAPAASAQEPEPVIRPGVTVAGVDVGGQTLSQAAGTIDRAYRHQLVTRNVSVRVGGKGYSLRTKKVEFVLDAAKSARRAYIAGNNTPAPQPVDVLPWTSYDKKKLAAFVARVDRSARVAPRDATVRITLQHMVKRASKSGREMDDKGLAKALAQALTDPRARAPDPAEAQGRASVTVRTKDLASRYGTVVTISKCSFRLRAVQAAEVRQVLRGRDRPARLPDAVAACSAIANKAVNPPWTAPNSPWAGAYRNETVAGRLGREPAQGALDGHRQRRRHPRHGRARLDRLPRLARLHPHDGART